MTSRFVFLIMICHLCFFNVCRAQDDRFRESCPFKRFDSVSVVKDFYGLTYDPQEVSSPLAAGNVSLKSMYKSQYQYEFAQFGIWIFLGSDLQVLSLRFNRPFLGKIAGVGIGDSKEEVLRIKGRPTGQIAGLVDRDVLQAREVLKLELLMRLPDPAPRKEVLKAFEEIAKLEQSPPQFTTAWIYDAGKPNFVRYDFGAQSGRVQVILSDNCVVE